MTINENTKITVGLLVTILGGGGWLTTIYATSKSNSESITEIKAAIEKRRDTEQTFREHVLQDLSKIKERLNVR